MLQRMVSRQCVSLRRLGGDRAGEVRFGRFVGNEGVTRAELLEGVCAGVAGRVAGLHVLAIEDTTELNYQASACSNNCGQGWPGIRYQRSRKTLSCCPRSFSAKARTEAWSCQ